MPPTVSDEIRDLPAPVARVINELLAQLDMARASLARGRARAVRSPVGSRPGAVAASGPRLDNARSDVGARRDAALVESFLAQLFTDGACRERYLCSPLDEAIRTGFSIDRAHRLERIDPTGFELAAESFARKRGKPIRDASWRALLRAVHVRPTYRP